MLWKGVIRMPRLSAKRCSQSLHDPEKFKFADHRFDTFREAFLQGNCLLVKLLGQDIL